MRKWTRSYYLIVQVDTKAEEYVKIAMPLTMNFHIKRSINADANTASITILNLSEDTRRKVFLDNYQTMYYKGIELYAGYPELVLRDGSTWQYEEKLPLIFKGNIQTAYSKRNGVDYETTIEALDGGFAYINGYTSRQFGKGTTDRQMLRTLVADLPNIEEGHIGNFNVSIERGNTLDGPTLDYFSTISEGNAFIDLEKMNCLLTNECFEGSLQRIDADCGLLGSPLRQEAFLTFEMVFEPRLQIGQVVELVSKTERGYNGTYKVIGLEHSGTISDAKSGQCKTKVSLNYIEGVPTIIK